jgi:hypothetical protein
LKEHLEESIIYGDIKYTSNLMVAARTAIASNLIKRGVGVDIEIE